MKKNDKKKTGTIKTVVCMLILAVIVVSFYVYLANRSKKASDNVNKNKTEVEKILARDIEINYPGTPTQVLKFYSRILTCYYKYDLTKELSALVDKQRMLYDDEFLNENPLDEYMDKLNIEIETFKKGKNKIVSYIIESSALVEYRTIDEKEYATLSVEYTMGEKVGYSKVIEEFIMRKDKDGNWKILGWKVADKTEVDGE